MQFDRKDDIAIMQQALISLLATHRLSQLLPRPLRRRMRRHVEVNESTAVVFDDDEHVQHAEMLVTAIRNHRR
jgi:hypothetical protein